MTSVEFSAENVSCTLISDYEYKYSAFMPFLRYKSVNQFYCSVLSKKIIRFAHLLTCFLFPSRAGIGKTRKSRQPCSGTTRCRRWKKPCTGSSSLLGTAARRTCAPQPTTCTGSSGYCWTCCWWPRPWSSHACGRPRKLSSSYAAGAVVVSATW